jgi:protein-tyrosine phosphatase
LPPFREPPTLLFDAIANFRDLGGHTTRDGARVASGRLFRSGHLAHATAADIARLAELGLRKVFDFRTLKDIEHEGPDQLPESTHHTRLPMPDPVKGQDLRSTIQGTHPSQMHATFGDGQAAAMMMQSAASMVRERSEPYRRFLTELADADAIPALFHCSAGKDRAGWAGSVVLLALGVDEEQVIEQYLLSNRAVDAIRKRLKSSGMALLSSANTGAGQDDERVKQRTGATGDIMLPFLEVRREYIDSSFQAMHEDWGSFDRYLHEGLGISEAQRELLRELLLE